MDPLPVTLSHAIDFLRRLLLPRDAPPTQEPPSAPLPSPTALPRPGSRPSHSRFGGRAWSYDAAGIVSDGSRWRTAGEPLTCRAILASFRAPILAASRKHGINPALIMMTIAVETGGLRHWGFTGPRSFRWEPHVLNRDVTPSFRGTYSAGPMQVLATTVRELVASHGGAFGLHYDPFALAPAFGAQPDPAPADHRLYHPETSIDLGTAVIRRQLPVTADDPILVAAAYNSGGLYESGANAWRLRSHGDHLDRAARWYGDACAVLAEADLL